MTKEEIAEIVHGMPQGMTADDYLVELVSRAVTPLEQRIKLLRDEVAWAENGYTKHKWVGLTEQEVTELHLLAGIIPWTKHTIGPNPSLVGGVFLTPFVEDGMDGDGTCLRQFAQLIEAKLKEKNT